MFARLLVVVFCALCVRMCMAAGFVPSMVASLLVPTNTSASWLASCEGAECQAPGLAPWVWVSAPSALGLNTPQRRNNEGA